MFGIYSGYVSDHSYVKTLLTAEIKIQQNLAPLPWPPLGYRRVRSNRKLLTVGAYEHRALMPHVLPNVHSRTIALRSVLDVTLWLLSTTLPHTSLPAISNGLCSFNSEWSTDAPPHEGSRARCTCSCPSYRQLRILCLSDLPTPRNQSSTTAPYLLQSW